MPYGISPTIEVYIPLRDGAFLVFPSVEGNAEGADYVRIVDAQGGERAYWSYTEWEESPIEVMGAILGGALSAALNQPPKFYRFAEDVSFPPDTELTDD